MKQLLTKTYALLDQRILKEIKRNKEKARPVKEDVKLVKSVDQFSFDPFWAEFFKQDLNGHKEVVFIFLGSLAVNEQLDSYKFYEKMVIKVIKKLIRKDKISQAQVTQYLISSIRKSFGTH